MKNFFKNLVWLLIAIVLSHYTSFYFGSLYSYFTSQDVMFMELPFTLIIASTGTLFAFIFLIVFIFSLFGFRKNRKWIMCSLIVPALLWLSSDVYDIYLPIIIGLVGFGLAFEFRRIFKSLYKPNPPMVVK
jgi:hypothetical protein